MINNERSSVYFSLLAYSFSFLSYVIQLKIVYLICVSFVYFWVLHFVDLRKSHWSHKIIFPVAVIFVFIIFLRNMKMVRWFGFFSS